MEDKTLEEIAKELLAYPGMVRGEIFRTHAEYIKLREGEEGLRRLKEKMKELGAPINFSETKPFEWVREGVSSLSIVTAKEIFNWTEKDVFEMGRYAPKVSFIIKLFVRYLVSPKKVFEEASKYWDKHFNFGSLEPVEYNEEKGIIRLRVRGYKTHPTLCIFHAGFFKGIIEFTIKSNKLDIKEVKCMHKGDDFHEYLITWKD